MFDFENTPITKYTKLKAQYNCGPQPVLTYYGDWARITLTGGATLELSSEAELNTLLASTTSAIVTSQTVNVADITRLEFGTKVTTIPTHSVHLDAWSKLKTINGFHEGFKKIGDYCFTPSNGDGWGNLRGNTIVLPSTMTGVGQLFLCACGDGNLTVIVNCPATIFSTTNPTYMLGAYEPNNPQYVNGIKIRGAYAQDFVAKFPNRSSVPYRNLYAESNSLSDFKSMLDAGLGEIYYPVGTEIPDTWNGNSNPLIVTQYFTTANSKYGGAIGTILIRKYVEPVSQQYSSNNSYGYIYTSSDILSYLSGDYYNKCSSVLKTLISPIKFQVSSGGGSPNLIPNAQYFFLMSACEMGNQGYWGSQSYEGVMWDYWIKKTGFSQPNANSSTARIATDRNGTAQPYWIRTSATSDLGAGYVRANSGITWQKPTNTAGVRPACFIPKN